MSRIVDKAIDYGWVGGLIIVGLLVWAVFA